MKINSTGFLNCKMHNVDFTNTEARSCQFNTCDLLGTKFDNTNLEKSNLSTAYNFEINPSINNLKDAVFSEGNLKNLLSVFKINVK